MLKNTPKLRKIVPVWQNDPWYDRSEEFYNMVYKGGSCRYCQKVITTPLDICDCAGMKRARARFQAFVRGEKKDTTPEPKFYNPNAFTEQDLEGIL